MKTFYVGIKGVIIKDGKVLLLHTNANHENRGDRWEMPGGKMDANETILQALNRELEEELPNIQNIEVGEILYAHRIQKDIQGKNSLVLIFYRVNADFKGGEPKLSIEHLEYKWAGQNMVAELAEDNTQPAVAEAFKTL